MADDTSFTNDLNLPPNLITAGLKALDVANMLVQPLFVNPYDLVPHELITHYGLTYEVLLAYSELKDEAELCEELKTEGKRLTYYALVGQQVLDTPALAASYQALREKAQPGLNDWDKYSAMLHQSLEVLVLIASGVAANGDSDQRIATLLLQRGKISGLFARLEPTLRPTSFEEKPAPSGPTPWTFTSDERQAAGMAVRLPQALIPISHPAFAQALRRLSRLSMMPSVMLQLRFDALPNSDDPADATLDCNPDELLLLWQGAEVSLMGMYAPVTPAGTWEDWLLRGPVTPGESEPVVRQRPSDEAAREYSKLCAAVYALAQRLRLHLSATHPAWAAAEAELAALRTAL